MSFTPNFTLSQPEGQPSVITVTDASTGSDGSINRRIIYIRKDDGTFLTPSGTTTQYIGWPLSDSTINIDCMDKDYALSVVVQWLDISGAILYDKTVTQGFTSYNENFDYQLTQMLAGNPLLFNDNDFQENKSKLRTDIDSGDQAILIAADIYNAQQCYDRATKLRTTAQYTFNENG